MFDALKLDFVTVLGWYLTSDTFDIIYFKMRSIFLFSLVNVFCVMLLDLDVFVVFPFPLLRPRGFNQRLGWCRTSVSVFLLCFGFRGPAMPFFYLFFFFSQSVTSVLSGFQLHTGFKQAMA